MMGGVSKQDLYALHNGAKLFMKKATLFWICKYFFFFMRALLSKGQEISEENCGVLNFQKVNI
jgi:hypothetical protein